MKEIIEILFLILNSFICNALLNICYAKITNRKFKFTKFNFIIILLGSFINLLNNSYFNFGVKMGIGFIIMIVEYKLIFKDSIKQSIVGYALIYAILIICEVISSNIFLKIGLINSNNITDLLTILKYMISSLTGIIEYMIISIKFIYKGLNKLIQLSLKYMNIYNFTYLMLFTITVIGLLNINNFINSESTKLALFLTLTLIFIILFFIVIKSRIKEEALLDSNKKLIEYNDKYGKFLDEYKIYKHNINHKLSAMKNFGNKKINSLIDSLLDEETTFSIRNNEIYNVPNGIKGIIAEKLYNKDYDIVINNKLKKDPFSKLDSKKFNSISECLGIALDNAIEATEETKNPFILIDIYEKENNLFIKVGNSFNNSININEIGNKYYSTKNRGSGLGLFSIMRNKIVKEKISIINDIYYMELQIKKHAN